MISLIENKVHKNISSIKIRDKQMDKLPNENLETAKNSNLIAENIFKAYSNLKKIEGISTINKDSIRTFFINSLIGYLIVDCLIKKNKKNVLLNSFFREYLKSEIPNFPKFNSSNIDDFYLLIGNELQINQFNIDKGLVLQQIYKIEKELQKIPNLNTINKIFGLVFEKVITKKEIGAYYTSDDTTNYITENAVIPSLLKNWYALDKEVFNSLLDNNLSLDLFIENKIKENQSLFNSLIELIKKDKNNSFSKVLSNLTIIDISCGSGSFIFSSYFLIKRLIKESGSPIVKFNTSSFFKNNLYGIDIDNEAIIILKFRIFTELLVNENFEDINLKEIFNNYILGNSLIKNVSNNSLNISRIFQDNNVLFNIINKGGFDVVLGNPPYLEYKKVSTQYSVDHLISRKCNNLYAFILEINFNILKELGHMGMIIPISYTSTKRMNPIRNLLTHNSNFQFCSNFADRPSCLFNGVHQKLNILLLEKNTSSSLSNIYTTSYQHWYNDERNDIFKQISYIENNLSSDDFFYKIGNKTEREIIKKITNPNNKSLLDYENKNGKFKVWLNMRMTFWCKSFIVEHKSGEYKCFNFENKINSILFSALLNSNIFYFFWECISDVWHITQKDLINIRIDFDKIPQEKIKKIIKLYNELENNISLNKRKIDSKQTEFEYQHKKDKVLIDKLDYLFSTSFGFTDIEIDYIRNYQLKFRLNGELEQYLKNYQK